MLLSEVVNKITEKWPAGVNLSIPSVISDVSELRRRLIRNYCTDIDTSTTDLLEDTPEYPLPCAQSDIKEVVVNGCPYVRGSLGSSVPCQYYYILDNTIGIYPTPTTTVTEGLMIFHTKSTKELTQGDWNVDAGLDKDHDMLLVYGVLKEIDPKYKVQYDELFSSFWSANLTPDNSVIRGRW
jgi:hypothetical protein